MSRPSLDEMAEWEQDRIRLRDTRDIWWFREAIRRLGNDGLADVCLNLDIRGGAKTNVLEAEVRRRGGTWDRDERIVIFGEH